MKYVIAVRWVNDNHLPGNIYYLKCDERLADGTIHDFLLESTEATRFDDRCKVRLNKVMELLQPNHNGHYLGFYEEVG